MDRGHGILGLLDIAQLLGTARHTPHTWHTRGVLPKPDYLISGQVPAWKRMTVLRWAVHTYRAPPSVVEEYLRLLGDDLATRQRKAARHQQVRERIGRN
jgi:hypothetical protein